MFRFDAVAGQIVRIEVYGPQSMLPEPLLAQSVTGDILDPGAVSKPSDWGSGVPVAGTLIATTGPHFVRLSVNNDDPTGYLLRVTVQSTGGEIEPNDDPQSATPLPQGMPASGVIDVIDDADLYAFEVAAADELVSFAVICNMPGATPMEGRQQLGSSLDARLVIRNAQGNPLAVSDTADQPYAQSVVFGESGCEIAFRAPAPGTYYVEVGDSNGTASPDHYYVLRRTH